MAYISPASVLVHASAATASASRFVSFISQKVIITEKCSDRIELYTLDSQRSVALDITTQLT